MVLLKQDEADDYGTHKTPTVKTWLATHPRFHVRLDRAATAERLASWVVHP